MNCYIVMNCCTSPLIAFDVCDPIIADLDALEQAIEEVCNTDTQTKIKERKREIKGAKE